MKESLFSRIIRLARSMPHDARVPYAFEKRIMALIRSAAPQDIWSAWLPTMRKAAVCGIAVLALTSVYLRYVQAPPADLLAHDLERTVLASVNSVNFDDTW